MAAPPPPRRRAPPAALQEPPRAGLFGVPELASPGGFAVLAARAEERAAEMGAAVVQAHALRGGAGDRGDTFATEMLTAMDALSDTVCIVADTAELCRNVHANEAYRAAADAAWRRVMKLIYAVNSDPALYAAVKSAVAQVDGEAKMVLGCYLREMEAGGVHLAGTPAGARHAAAAQAADTLSHRFNMNIGAAGGAVMRETLARLPSTVLRRAAFVKDATAAEGNLSVLVDLLQARHAMAAELGHESFASMATASLMARSPETVRALLAEFDAAVTPHAAREDDALAREAGLPSGARVTPWDRPFYSMRRSSRALGANGAALPMPLDALAEYTLLPSVLEGLSELLERFLGLSLVEAPMGEGEAWAQGVSKYALVCPDEGVLGYVYLDLLSRQSKRLVSATQVVRAGKADDEQPNGYRVATVALLMNMGAEHCGGDPARVSLTHEQLTTLLHEFGHVLHALLSRTRYQSTSGIRCTHDFVEVPSTVFERFAADREALKLLARHRTTREPLPDEAIDALLRAKSVAPASILANKLAYSMLDQHLHSSPPPVTAADTIAAYATIYSPSIAGVGEHVDGTWPHATFHHLAMDGYTARYYSYLYSGAFAACVWRDALGGSLAASGRDGGEVFRRRLLEPGGGRDPGALLADMLGPESMRAVEGDAGGLLPNVQRCVSEAVGEL